MTSFPTSSLCLVISLLSALHPTPVNCFRILAFFPMELYSHDVPFFNVFDELVSRGHEVTLVSHFALPHTSPARYNHIQLQSVNLIGRKRPFNPRDLSSSMFDIEMIRSVSSFCLRALENIKTQEILDFIQNHTGKYDVIVAEVTFCGHLHVALAHKFNAPLVNFHPLGYEAGQFSLLGALALPGAAVDVRVPYTDRSQSLLHRANSLFVYLYDLWDMYTYYLPEIEKLLEEEYKYPGWESRPPLLPLLHNISLTLMEYDPRIIGLSFPVPANVVFVGGLHMRPARPLPSDLERFMKAPGKKGVIFVSLGTILQFSHFDIKTVKAFADVFKQLDYNVIWKLDVNVTVPDHVMTGTWFPQEDILGHPNCKLFITHGGIHSAMETVYYSVPVLVMPGFADQFQNAQLMEEKGIGLVILADTLTKDSLLVNLHEVLTKPQYRNTVQRLSQQVHAMPLHNLDVAAGWIEYVAKNQGAPGLSPAARQSSIWHVLALDLMLGALGLDRGSSSSVAAVKAAFEALNPAGKPSTSELLQQMLLKCAQCAAHSDDVEILKSNAEVSIQKFVDLFQNGPYPKERDVLVDIVAEIYRSVGDIVLAVNKCRADVTTDVVDLEDEIDKRIFNVVSKLEKEEVVLYGVSAKVIKNNEDE